MLEALDGYGEERLRDLLGSLSDLRHGAYSLIDYALSEAARANSLLLEKTPTDAEFRFRQGYIAALRDVIDYPDLIRGEVTRRIEEAEAARKARQAERPEARYDPTA